MEQIVFHLFSDTYTHTQRDMLPHTLIHVCMHVWVYIKAIKEKDAMNFKRAKWGTWEQLEGGKESEK